jgi:methyl-accepting chemotaxis protein PixJ
MKPTNQPEIPGNLNWSNRIKLLLQQRLVETIAVSTLVSLGLMGGSTWSVWHIYQELQTTIARQFKVQELSGQVVHLDEVLTMSARMAASTSNSKWELRYNQYVPQLDAAIKNILQGLPKSQQSNPEQTDAANQKLVAFEDKAFKLVREGKSTEALQILLGPEYEQQKSIYDRGIQGTLAQIKQDVTSEIQAYRQQLNQSLILAIASLLIVAATWYVVYLAVKAYIRDRQTSQSKILEFQDDLLQTNNRLETEKVERNAQEQQILQESLLLQDDIAHILDIVSAIEEGDLTVTADINERATGLIGDTLNRTIESLNQIIAQVKITTQQVTTGAIELDKLALDTAAQAQAQTNSIDDIQSLMSEIGKLAQNSRQQSIATDAAVKSVQIALQTGQQEINSMGYGIATLEQGTEQIINRTRLLNEFVAISSQFSKHQKRTAALTKVLALNASILSERAIGEQDPAQFATIASEFATIAKQVNDLAVETSSSLTALQQSTDRVQTTTSGLSQDVFEIGNLVQKFTSEVRKSHQAFEHIETAIDRVTIAKEQVNSSSQEISTAIDRSVSSIQSVAALADATSGKAHTTQTQVRELANLATALRQDIAFFQLDTTNSLPSTNSISPSTVTTQIDNANPNDGNDSTLVKSPYEMILTL